MKLRVYNIERPTKETDIDLPIYFYTQGELFDEEFIRINKNGKTTIKRGYSTINIEYHASDFTIPSHYLDRYESTKEFFNEAFKFSVKQLKQ